MNETMMTSLLIQLADLGVTGIKITYEGSGDSGCIENVFYTTDNLPKNEEDAIDAVNELEPWDPGIKHLDLLHSGLCSDIQNFAEEKILNDVEDWWNNEGGFGHAIIDLSDLSYEIENNIYITSTESFSHSGVLDIDTEEI